MCSQWVSDHGEGFIFYLFLCKKETFKLYAYIWGGGQGNIYLFGNRDEMNSFFFLLFIESHLIKQPERSQSTRSPRK